MSDYDSFFDDHSFVDHSFFAFDDIDLDLDDPVDSTAVTVVKEAHPRKAAYLPQERTRAGYKALRKRGKTSNFHFKVHGQKWNDKSGNSLKKNGRKNAKRASISLMV